MDGSNSRADDHDEHRSRRLPAPMMGAVAAAGAVSLGLVLIGSCGLDGEDTYVAPPPLNADLQAAPTGYARSSTTTPVIVIPPSPTWRVAADRPPRRTTTTTTVAVERDEDREYSDTETTTRTTRPTTPRTTRPTPSTTTERTETLTRPPTEEPTTITEDLPTTVVPTFPDEESGE
ncbi:hypothetical protein IU501_02470 [Nocardia otitidiscaviarum]|uniref:hypothetical protein n=1 Tax=Nocardia otitidiscaviarum TaxID=1823 RepID=UPI0006949A39|nr:hypothetical protein [Nocardia otitidiscaviarum]MBF6131867.1 hypothetical protein [Nocardia otitidiscaviarum]MBF6482998.1 hypothetical protein [Nocardia otitidiscaviarum]